MESDYTTLPLADLCEMLSNKTLELLKRIERKDFEKGIYRIKKGSGKDTGSNPPAEGGTNGLEKKFELPFLGLKVKI